MIVVFLLKKSDYVGLSDSLAARKGAASVAQGSGEEWEADAAIAGSHLGSAQPGSAGGLSLWPQAPERL